MRLYVRTISTSTGTTSTATQSTAILSTGTTSTGITSIAIRSTETISTARATRFGRTLIDVGWEAEAAANNAPSAIAGASSVAVAPARGNSVAQPGQEADSEGTAGASGIEGAVDRQASRTSRRSDSEEDI